MQLQRSENTQTSKQQNYLEFSIQNFNMDQNSGEVPQLNLKKITNNPNLACKNCNWIQSKQTKYTNNFETTELAQCGTITVTLISKSYIKSPKTGIPELISTKIENHRTTATTRLSGPNKLGTIPLKFPITVHNRHQFRAKAYQYYS